jgi:hypothetical protein
MPSVVMLATFDGGKFTVGTSSVKVVEPLSIVWMRNTVTSLPRTLSAVWI